MTYTNAIILGLVQGLTEFLPVSSSGHLVIMQSLLPGFKGAGLAFDTLLHLATLVTVLVYFRKEIFAVISGTAGKPVTGEGGLSVKDSRRLALLIIIATIPTGVIGLAFKKKFEYLFSRPDIVGIMLLITGTLMFAAERWAGKRKNRREKQTVETSRPVSLLIGITQGLAVTPGISRSGSTIAAGIFCSLERNWAARFSFLISIPAISGAFLLQSREIIGILFQPGELAPALAGMLVAGISGYLAIDILLKLVSREKLSYFSYYCWAVGLVAVFYFI